MLKIGPVRVETDELLWMEWTEREVGLGLKWRWEEVPGLLDLPAAPLLQWEHLEIGQGGIRLALVHGSVKPEMRDGPRCVLVHLRFRRVRKREASSRPCESSGVASQ